jgi:hypothetical protein
MPEQADPRTDAPPSHETSRHGVSTWLIIFFVLFVLYPLGIGPAARIHNRYPATRRAIEILYAPITSAGENSRVIRHALEWYVVNVWGLK